MTQRDLFGNDTPPRRRRPNLGPEIDQQIRADYETGMSIIDLAAKWNYSRSTILYAIRRAGGALRSLSESISLRAKKDRAEQAANMGLPKDTDIYQLIRADYETGMSSTELAAKWGRPPASVLYAVRRAGGTLRSKGESYALAVRKKHAERAAAMGLPSDIIPINATEQRCACCLLIKPLDEFAIAPRMMSGRRSECRMCVNDRQNRMKNGPRAAHYQRLNRKYHLQKNFGITHE